MASEAASVSTREEAVCPEHAIKEVGPDLWLTLLLLKLDTSELKLGCLVTWKVLTLTLTLDFTKHAFLVILFKVKNEDSPTE